ncbi:CheR family methyltransferase [Pseudomonas abyssi]|uniref:Chemotaxis protein methyltransferase n=1 Tax=Pseudomonas abyssi TaxID=170540 RepID=A0A395RAU5_9PSED|nr:CheR family methyltransferase [Halopseudomonas gallaeciensis]RGP57163.1 chemotaxis protein CheR [Halopseudomonas gallaeciensis]
MTRTEIPEREFSYAWEDFESVRKLLYSSTGISMADSKFQLVYSRLARRLRALRLHSVNDYLNYLKNHSEEQEHFVNALTTNLTAFFREPHHFDALARFLKEKAGRGRRFTLWCAAASTGEEPYSMAMVALEALGDSPPVSIIATDIDSQVLQQARQGVYAAERCKGLSNERLKQFCLRGRAGTPQQGMVKMRPALQRLIEFRTLNLLSSQWALQPPFDIIFCRNVMIYFDKPTQRRLLERMVPMLVDDGLYIAGHSESFTNAGNLVRLVDRTVYVPVRKVK